MNRKKISRRSVLTVILVLVAMMGGFMAGQAMEKQPHMRAALNDLQKAKTQLAQAEADKGGHRVKAEELVNQAIDEVQRGIQFDNQH